MTSFEAGFFKYAQEYGLSEKQAAYILKRALDLPEAGQMFKELPVEQEEQQAPQDLEFLKELMDQQAINQNFQEYENQAYPQ